MKDLTGVEKTFVRMANAVWINTQLTHSQKMKAILGLKNAMEDNELSKDVCTIDSCFTWSHRPEGHHFWSSIDARVGRVGL